MTFSKSGSKRSNLCRNDPYIFGKKHVSVSKWHCVEIVCFEVTGTRLDTSIIMSPPVHRGGDIITCVTWSV